MISFSKNKKKFSALAAAHQARLAGAGPGRCVRPHPRLDDGAAKPRAAEVREAWAEPRRSAGEARCGGAGGRERRHPAEQVVEDMALDADLLAELLHGGLVVLLDAPPEPLREDLHLH